MKRKIMLISLSVLTTVLVALITVFMLIKFFEFKTSKEDVLSSDAISVFGEMEQSSVNGDVSSESEESSTVSAGSESTNKDNGIRLVLTSPTTSKINTTEPTFTFNGTSDPAEPVFLNGISIGRNESGEFTYLANLKIGDNSFRFEHKGISYYYTVNYRFVVISYYNPSKAVSLENGAQMPVTVTARNGSQVTAAFRGNSITLNPQTVVNGEEFINYSGSFTLPSGSLNDLNLGKITFKATFNGVTESFSSGDIICKKPSNILDSNPSATPNGSRYIDVGSGKIAEVVAYEAETFDAYSTNDWSKPTNNYLPKGTVDYSSSKYVYSKDSEPKEYAVLRYGKQVYTSRKDTPNKEKIPVIKEYAGTLPDHNEVNIVSFSNGTRHTTLTLAPMWKAPFYLEVLQQKYNNVAIRDYGFSAATYSYIDITLCYTTVLTGEISVPADNPLFRSAEIIKNSADYTLRLHLKKTGFFYGWDANYNEKGELVFEFLNPARIKTVNNAYGADLSGVSILIDVGHGGKDPGALGADSNHTEAIQNLILAQKLKAELQSIGATVTLTRDSNVTSSSDDKIKMLKALKPDYCIAIHHNSSGTNKNKNGFSAHFFHPYSKIPADKVRSATAVSGLYKDSGVNWHNYFMARSYYCPVVLTENGYMSNSYDYGNIINESYNVGKAKALTKGIVSYFLSIQ